MSSEKPPNAVRASERRRFVTHSDIALSAAAFLATLILALLAMLGAELVAANRDFASLATITLFALVVAGFLAWRSHLRGLWHAAANYCAPDEAHALSSPYVVDGDTIGDRATGVRYRLANIDAPETGDRARCWTERLAGEDAKAAALALIGAARVVAVRPTWRWDRFGRKVAFVLVDGRDLGELLLNLGLAARWRGRRVRWCGSAGAFAKLAGASGGAFACRTCAPRSI